MAQVSCFLICCCDFCFLSAEWQRPEAVGDLDKIAMRVSFLGLGGEPLAVFNDSHPGTRQKARPRLALLSSRQVQPAAGYTSANWKPSRRGQRLSTEQPGEPGRDGLWWSLGAQGRLNKAISACVRT